MRAIQLLFSSLCRLRWGCYPPCMHLKQRGRRLDHPSATAEYKYPGLVRWESGDPPAVHPLLPPPRLRGRVLPSSGDVSVAALWTLARLLGCLAGAASQAWPRVGLAGFLAGGFALAGFLGWVFGWWLRAGLVLGWPFGWWLRAGWLLGWVFACVLASEEQLRPLHRLFLLVHACMRSEGHACAS